MVKNKQDDATDVIMVTEEGLQELQAELAERKEKQIEIANEIDEARSLGDLRENEPYQTAMQKKEMNDTRIDELEYMISVAQVVEADPDGKIGIGNKVTLEALADGRKREVNLVGKQESQEADPREGKISIDSPIGVAILGKKAGDEIEVSLPVGNVKYKIAKVA